MQPGTKRIVLPLLAVLALPVCSRQPEGIGGDTGASRQFSPQDWTTAGIPGDGGFLVEGEALVLAAGDPMSGVVLRANQMELARLPVDNYRIAYQAMRAQGVDFFGSVTFPVHSLETCVTLVLGGWGGGLVGISSIDGLDASENATRSEQRFENDRWYDIVVEVAGGAIRVMIDGRLVVNVSVAGRRIGLRGGDIERCAPLGFATWRTCGHLRRVMIEVLDAGPERAGPGGVRN